MAIADVSATMYLQGITAEYPVDEAQRLWLNGVAFGDNVPAEQYQDGSNFTSVDDEFEQVLRNVKYLSATTAEVDLLVNATYGQAIYGTDIYGLIAAATFGESLYGEQSYGGNLVREGAAQTVILPIPRQYCQLHIRVTSSLPISITSPKFYAYDGIDDVNLFRGIHFQAAEGEVSTTWVAANGLSQALVLQDHPSPDGTHDFYVALSASPDDTGDRQGKIKFIFTYAQ